MTRGYRNAPYFEGPVGHEVTVLRVTDPEGKLVAVLFGHACHNTTMGDYLIRGDYAGYAQQYLEEEHPGVTALFMIGCGADQNPYPRGKEELAKYHGRSLALAVEAALQTSPKPLRGPLCVALEDVTLEFAPIPPREELEKTAAAGREPDAGHAKRLLKELQETGKIRSTYPCPVQVVRFGRDLTLVALGGERVIDYSLNLKRELAGPSVWVAGYSNDVFTYLPSARVLREGGYEAGGATVWGSLPGPFTADVEERGMTKALELARKPIESQPVAVDLNVGQEATVKLVNGQTATVKLLEVKEQRDSLRNALRLARVTVEVNGHPVTLGAATYHLPVTVGDIQIDCPITKGYNQNVDYWGLGADARLRLWPAGYPLITPGTFAYSHLDSIDPAAVLGARVKIGQKIGVLGKQGASGVWSHLHFDIVAPQPSGRWGILEGYALLFEAYHDAHPLEVLEAVARPHQLAAVGETVTLDGSRSWSRHGQDHIASYSWTFSDGKTARGTTAERRYDKPGAYSEILKVVDKDGNIDYDFALVRVQDPNTPDQKPPSIHAAYWPTWDIKAGDELTFNVRSFNVAPDEGQEEWDFGDGTPPVCVQADGNAQTLAPDGYAVTQHTYQAAGHYLVKVSRTNRRGETATARLDIIVRP